MIDAEAEEICLIKSADTPVISAELCGHDIELTVDTGNTGSFTLPKEVFEKLVEEGAIQKLEQGLESMTATGMAKLEVGFFLKGELMGEPL